MASIYVDTSALGRVLLAEPGADATVAELARYDDVVSSWLLRIELRRLGGRNGLDDEAQRLIANVTLMPVDDALLGAAELVLPTNIATLDAIHLVTALRLVADGELDGFMTYNAQLAAGAVHHGLRVVAPQG